MTTKRVISGFFCALPLMGRVWFNCNEFLVDSDLFSQTRDGFKYCYSRLALSRLCFKNIFLLFYFIL